MVESTIGSRWAGQRTTVARVSAALPTLVLALVLTACADESPPAAPQFDPRPLAEELARALVGDDIRKVVDQAHATLPLRIELRETLVETDERSASTVVGGQALLAWIEENRPLWRCSGRSCRWPGGLVATGDWKCFGDCCDLRPPGGMELETLYLRRVCLAHRQDGRARLSLLAFYEAR